MNEAKVPLTTILLDLDDTLLESNMAQFIPAYLDKLAEALADFAPKERLKSLVLKATASMVANQDPDVTNEQAFRDAFFPTLGGQSEEIKGAVDRFYHLVYPSLKSYVTLRPEARFLVHHLVTSGHKVVIATNPLFPCTAIEQRMGWAGILGFPYTLITCQENMHSCKPSLAYYKEILRLVKAVPAETLMVGDDPKNDIVPARMLGLETWWITDLSDLNAEVSADYQGTLAEFWSWVQQGGLKNPGRNGVGKR